ncbi:MAG: ASKHA domain-containing protein [Chloroflexota bacterium]
MMAKNSANQKRRVHFEPGNVDIVVEPGANLLETAIQAGVRLIASCGGEGTCGTCKVVIKEGEVETKRTAKLSDEEYQRGVRQACQSKVITDLKVYLPVESRLETAILVREQKSTGARQQEALATGWRFSPPLKKYFVELPPPTLNDNVSDLSRLLRGLKQDYKLSNMTVDFEVVANLPRVLREQNWQATVTILVTAVESQTAARRRPRLVNVEPGDTRKQYYSLAIDIGTTTVKAQLLDLTRGRVIAEDADYNGQISYGRDVVTRITYCQRPDGLPTLQKAVVTTINEILGRLLVQSKVDVGNIGHVIVAGNTTMLQILLGIDPKYIRLAPYTPAATYVPPVKAKSLGVKVGGHVYLFTFPLVASYVGGDIVSGVVAAGVHQTKKLTFYMDIGTNGEIVIGKSDWMVTAACSAGPAFEGGEIKHGMIATSGAIEDFSIDATTIEPTIGTIGDEKPKGICGSGLINIVAGLLEARAISPNGKFNTDLPGKRIREGNEGYEYVLAWAPETQTDKDIVITETDIDNLMRAKAAMYAGCQTLVKSVGLTCNDIEQVIIAGAFGSYINIEKAITIGLLPDLPREKFIFIGNGSLMGARLGSFSIDILDEVRRVARLMTNFELSENVDFMNNYVAALFFPHTNADDFPNITEKLGGKKKRTSKRRVTV